MRKLPSLLALVAAGGLAACSPDDDSAADIARDGGETADDTTGPEGDADAPRPDAEAGDDTPVGDGDAEDDVVVGELVPLYGTAEVVLHAGTPFDAAGGSPNPFTDVTLVADVVGPGGASYEVEGFFDGDGAGGSVGDVFRLRLFAAALGVWSWTTRSSVPALDGQTGAFTCRGTLPGVFGEGPIEVDPAHPRAFRRRDGGPVYLLGKFLDVAAPAPIQYSHTFLSEELSDGDREAMLARHVGMRLHKLNAYLANRGDYRGVSTTPWVGTADANDKQRFDLARWHAYDAWVVRLRDAGLVAQLWFFADDSDFGDLPDADRRLLLRYGMARLSAYANTMFTLCLEWQEGWSAADVEDHATYLQTLNPWDRLVSVHGTTGDFAFPTAAWADYLDIQSGNDADPSTVHSMGLANRALAARPLVNEEFGLGDEDAAHRRKAWAAFVAGAAGSGTGAFLAHLAAFTEQVDFERMEPHDALATSGRAWVLAEPGVALVAFLEQGGSVGIDLSSFSGTLAARWYDPRAGTFSSAGSPSGGGVASFTAPDADDWVLLVDR
jgi:hypothetical protein